MRDFAQVRADGRINREVADKALAMLEVDHEGLDPMDKKILGYILDECDGGPVGIGTNRFNSSNPTPVGWDRSGEANTS